MTRSRQRTLFDSAVYAIDEPLADLVAHVVFNRPMRTTFTYTVPQKLCESIAAGKRVLAPFGKGNRRSTGYCVGVAAGVPHGVALKPIAAVIDERPLLAASMIDLTKWIADYYFCSWGQVLEAVLPRAVKDQTGTRWAVLLTPVSESERPAIELTAKQRRAFETLCAFGRSATVKEIGQRARCGPECVKALVKSGLATAHRQRMHHRPPRLAPVVWSDAHVLNKHQQTALDRIVAAIIQGRSQTFLLHGVTGSGKTEVYLRAIGEVVRRRREAIVLVPEISLTPQTIERFRQRFDHVAVLHSHLSDADRNWHWQRIAAGEIQVVIGARSAVFAPCRNLGLVVIDEEHEATFKQESTPRYHAREVALQRSQLERLPVVLGSATPSLESWHAAASGAYELLTLPERVSELPMPHVGLVDLRNEFGSGKLSSLSRPLVTAMRETLEMGGQIILLLNRRGFSTTILCPQCGHTERCRHCDIVLTLHKDIGQMVCHSCDAEFPVPVQCPQCGKTAIRYSGFGTERLEDEVRSRFPDCVVDRMDSDTMRSAAHYDNALAAFRKGKTQILLGTQMIAKGLDVPNVRLVGVVNADVARNLPDFRASERTFQLVAQVAGRTGRGAAPGRVLVQTFNPSDPALMAASKHDYLRFVNHELPARDEHGYPPFQTLVRIIVRAKTESTARKAADLLAGRLRAQLGETKTVRVLGPAPAPIPRLRDYYRMHFQVHTSSETDRQHLLAGALDDVELPGDAEYAVDVDPLSML